MCESLNYAATMAIVYNNQRMGLTNGTLYGIFGYQGKPTLQQRNTTYVRYYVLKDGPFTTSARDPLEMFEVCSCDMWVGTINDKSEWVYFVYLDNDDNHSAKLKSYQDVGLIIETGVVIV